MFSAGKSWEDFILKLPKIPKIWESWELVKKLKNSSGAEICRERADKPYIPKKAPFSHR